MIGSRLNGLSRQDNWVFLLACILFASIYLGPSKSFCNDVIYAVAIISAISFFKAKKVCYEIFRSEKELVAFFVITILSCLWGDGRSFFYALKSSLALIFLMFFLLRFTDVFIARFDAIMGAVMLFATGWAILLVGFHVSDVGVDWTFSKMEVHYGPVIQTIRSASILAVALLIALWAVFYKQGWLRIVGGLSIFPLLYTILLLHSRGAILAFCVGFTALYLFHSVPAKGYKKCLTGLLLFSVLMVTGILFNLYFNPKGISDTVRIPIWLSALNEIYPEKLFLGKGYSKDQTVIVQGGATYVHAHNFIVSILRGTGLIGISLFLIYVFKAFSSALKAQFNSSMARLSASWLILGLSTAFFNGKYPVYVSPDIVLILWLPLAFLVVANRFNSIDELKVRRSELTSDTNLQV